MKENQQAIATEAATSLEATETLDTDNTLFFDIALVVYIIWGCLRDADVAIQDFMFINLRYVAYLSIMFSGLSIVSRYPLTLFRVALMLVVIGLAYFFKQAYLYLDILPLAFLVFAAYEVNIDHIVRIFLKATALTTLFIFLLSMLGILPDKVFDHGIGDMTYVDAHTFGFFYYSGFSYRCLLITLCYLYINRHQCTNAKLLGVTAFILLVYFFSSTRLQFLISFAMVFMVVLVYKLEWLSFKSKLWKYFSMVAYPAAFLFFVMLPFASFVSPEFLDWWDEAFNGRMTQTIIGFVQYRVGLWGNAIEMIGSATAETTTQEYFYIDSGYAYWLLAYGIVFTSFVLGAYSTVFYRTYKYRSRYVYAWCLVFAFVNMINDFFTLSYYCPTIFFLFAKFAEPAVETEEVEVT